MNRFAAALVLSLLVGAFGCGGEATPAAPAAPVPRDAPATPALRRVVFLGDSLTAGLGLEPDQSYPSLLQHRMSERGYPYQVINAGVSGDTSAGGLRRLDWSLDGDVQILVVALGANDGLRGLSTADLKKNLSEIIERASAREITVVLAGMEAPPNNGVDYVGQFRGVYAELAKTYRVRFIPFLLDGVAGTASLNQGDGIHPNVRGAQIVADLVWTTLEPALSKSSPVSR